MVQQIKSQVTKVITKNGECEITISLDININLNNNQVNLVDNNAKKIEQLHSDKEEENATWAIPEFKNSKIKFGE